MTRPNRDLTTAADHWRHQGYTDREITKMTAILDQSAAVHPAMQLKNRLDRIKDGRLAAIPWPWPGVTRLCPSLTPGAVTVLAGSPGASKSFGVLQCLSFWIERGYEVALFALEGTRAQHLQRMLAQLEGNSALVDLAWVRGHPDEVDAAMTEHADWLDVVGRCITCPDGLDQVTHEVILDWLDSRARRGDRILVVDPVTVADSDGQPWVEDRRFVYAVKCIADRHGVSVLLVTHPAKNTTGPSLDGLSGGAAYQRHVDAVLWLQAVDPKEVTVMTPCGRCEIEITRILHLLKVRDGRGQGMTLGYLFDPGTLMLAEQGLIVKETKGARYGS